jgi:tetratricopeptide (TPR) repeat protein
MSLIRNTILALASLLAFLLLTEGGLALVGVEPELYDKDPLVGFSSRIPLFVEAERGETLVTARNKRAIFNTQNFERTKPPGTYRIFCMGGSTTYGRPYADSTSFCGWLRELLPIADPSRNWQLINAGGISYASYRVAALMEELIEYQPDLFIIYSGHNEFLERRTYAALLDSSPLVLESRALLNRTRSYSLLKRVVQAAAGGPPSELSTREVLPGEVQAVLDDSVGLQAYQRDEPQQAKVLAHYRFNLERMIDIADSVGAGSVFVTPASNLRSCSPFKSEAAENLTLIERLEFEEWLSKARRRRSRGRLEKALLAVDAAIAIDPRRADARYLRGRILYEIDRFKESRQAFLRALEEDVCPLRALPEALQIVARVAEDRDVPLLRWVEFLADRALEGIPGEDFFLDHVHPTIDANRLLALELISLLHSEGIVAFDSSWDQRAISRVTAEIKGSLEPGAHARALTNLAKVLGWAGKHGEAHELAVRVLETVDDAEAYYNAAVNAVRLGRVEEAIGYFEEVLKREPDHAPAMSDLGFIYANLARYRESEDYLRRAIGLKPADERAHYNLGHLLVLEDRFDEAVIELRRALQINPERGEYHQMLGNVYGRLGQPAKAISEYERAIEVNPRLPSARLRVAEHHLSNGESKRAKEELRAVLELAPNSRMALLQLTWILASDADASLRDGAKAVRLAEGAARLTQHGDAAALDALAAAYAEVGRFEDARETGHRALERASARGSEELVKEVEDRLELYEAGRPYRRTQ